MCLASEAEKMEARSSQPSGGSSSLCAQSSTEIPDREEQKEASELPLTTSSSSSSSTSGSTLSSPTETSPCKTPKKKKKKKENKESDENPASPKKMKKRQSPESDLDSVTFTIEAVVKGAWGSEETPKKKSRPSDSESSPTAEQSPSVKKKPKPKPKKQLKLKDDAMEKEEEDADKVVNKPQDVEMIIEEAPMTPKTECEDELDVKVEPSSGVEDAVLQFSPMEPTEVDEKEDSDTKPLESRQEDKDPEVKQEVCGSRKSERSCKGALYKTLVSEGMLTSLRANVDRGNASCFWLILSYAGCETHYPLLPINNVDQIVAWKKHTFHF